MSTQLHDVDPIETKEWLDALSSVLEYEAANAPNTCWKVWSNTAVTKASACLTAPLLHI